MEQPQPQLRIPDRSPGALLSGSESSQGWPLIGALDATDRILLLHIHPARDVELTCALFWTQAGRCMLKQALSTQANSTSVVVHSPCSAA